MSDNRRFPQLQPFTLAGSGAVAGAITVFLSAFNSIDGVALDMTAFGTKGYITLEPGSLDFEEQISFTGITQNANGTATLTGVSNVLFLYPYTETAGLAKSHGGGVTAVVSNTSGFYDTFANKNDTETITQEWTFPSVEADRPKANADTDAVGLADYITFGQLSRTAMAGTVNASEIVNGVVELATNVETGAGTSIGATGARLVPPNSLLNAVSTGAPDVGKIPVAGASGTVDQSWLNSARTIGAVYSFTADNCQITTDPNSANDAVRFSYLNGVALSPWGDASDGDVTISGNTTLTRDMFYNNLTIDATFNLITGGFTIYVKEILTNNGFLHNDGAAGAVGANGAAAGVVSGGVPGTAGAGVTVPPSQASGAGADGDNGAPTPGGNGTNTGTSIGSAGSNGGAGGAGGVTAGAAGGTGGTKAATASYQPRTFEKAVLFFQHSTSGLVAIQNNAGAGGGGEGGQNNTGGTEASAAGGGGGGAGGIVLVLARSIAGTGVFQANGGNGGNGGDGYVFSVNSGGGGGGAGGNGGTVIRIYSTISGSTTTSATSGTGGSGGAPAGAGVAGSAGSAGTAGTITNIVMSA